MTAERDHGQAQASGPTLRALVQYTALRMHDAAGNEYDSFRQGAGALNVGGAVALAQSIDTSIPTGSWWLKPRKRV